MSGLGIVGMGRAGGVGKMFKMLKVRRRMLIATILIRGMPVKVLPYAHENKINFLKYWAGLIFLGYFKFGLVIIFT